MMTISSPTPIRPAHLHPTPIPTHTLKPLSPSPNRRYLNRPKAKPKAIERVLNLYEPEPAPTTLNARKPMHLYDINCAMPFHILETEHVRLEPFVPLKHLAGFLALPSKSWDVLGDLGPYLDKKSALEDIEEFRQDTESLLIAVVDKQVEARGGNGFAGVYGLMEYDEDYLSVLFGLINILPKYQKTHVNTHAMSLILNFLFDDLHMVRVQYDAVTWNEASIRAAQRFGFKAEGVCRNMHGLVPTGKRREGERDRKSQDLWMSSMTDYEWENEGRERLKGMLKRPVVDTSEF